MIGCYQPKPPAVTRVRFPSRFHRMGVGSVVDMADFQLGPGPCGKTVKALHVEWEPKTLAIIQLHADNTSKRFVYRRKDILGRVEIEKAA